MSSPVQLLQSYPGDNLFATPNFDEIRESHDNDLAYFDSLDTSGDSFMLDNGDASNSWDLSAQKDRPGADSLLDPFLTSNPPFGSGPELDSGEAMFTTRELTPPPSAVEEKSERAWPVKTEHDEATQKPQTTYTQKNGQITPPLSSKSPESEHAAETVASKRTRKATAKATVQKSSPPPSTTPVASASKSKAPRKTRKSKDDAESNGEESQSEGAKAKRARFLERNRQAAYTCRQRKKQWAKDLENRHRDLERDNQNLKMVLVSLKDEYHYLRQQVVQHSTCECTGAREYIQRASRVLEGTPDVEPGPDPLHGAPSTLAGASLPHYGKPDPHGMDFVHEGAELDGMTL